MNPSNQLIELFLASPSNAFMLTWGFFLFLYFFFAGIALVISRFHLTQFKISKADYSRQQIVREIKYSLLSIFIFALQLVILQQVVVNGWASINPGFSLLTYFVEVLLLFFWNEIHFYSIHWLLHRTWWFKKFHYIHHQSYHPTPFSIYSFSWVEAFLLGSVVFLPLMLHQFQFLSLLSLPVLSILLNVMGHWDYDFFPNKKHDHWLRASFRHSLHHSKVSGNFGFQLSVFDKLFNNELKK
jgi:Delta7-sterol 5-desaturase